MHLIHSAQNFSHFAKKSACGIRTLHQTILLVKGRTLALNGSFQKTSIPPPQRKLEVNPPPPSDVLIHLLLSETILSPLPLRMAEISSVGGVWIFSGTTHFRKHPYHPHRGNWKLTPLPPSDVLIHLLLSETILSPIPLRTAAISSVGGVWIFSGTTQWVNTFFGLDRITFSSFGLDRIRNVEKPADSKRPIRSNAHLYSHTSKKRMTDEL
jgi:hypothetical protein